MVFRGEDFPSQKEQIHVDSTQRPEDKDRTAARASREISIKNTKELQILRQKIEDEGSEPQLSDSMYIAEKYDYYHGEGSFDKLMEGEAALPFLGAISLAIEEILRIEKEDREGEGAKKERNIFY